MTRADLLNCITACAWAQDDIDSIAKRTGLDTTQQKAAFALTAASAQREVQEMDKKAKAAMEAAAKDLGKPSEVVTHPPAGKLKKVK